MSGISLAKSLELHLLQPLITREEVRAACERAAAAHLAAVCVWPAHVALAAEVLASSDTRVRAAIGFPYGQDAVATKLAACDLALADGASELAVMLDHSAMTVGAGASMQDAATELERVLGHAWWSGINAARGRAELTIVLETMLLDLERLAPLLAQLRETTAGFVQTGSGHQSRAVTERHIRELRELLPADIAIVAVGGVTTLEDAASLVTAGAVRVGSGSATAIIDAERAARIQGNAAP